MTASQAAATDAAIADVIDWLSARPDMRSHMKAIGEALSGASTRQLRQAIPAPDRRPTMEAMADHLWCGVLTALSCTLGTVTRDDIPEAVTTRVIEARLRDRRAPLDGDIIAMAIATAWGNLRWLPAFGDVETGRRAARIMVTLMCPALYRHPAAIHHSLMPLAEEDVVSVVTMHRLKISGVLS